MMKKYLYSFLCLMTLAVMPEVNAQRIKDLADVAGVRSNQLIKA